MSTWSDIQIEGDLKQFQIELNRKLRHAFANIGAVQIGLSLNSIPGTLALTKGGTGSNLNAPATDRIFFYDKSANKTDWLDVGNGLIIDDTTLKTTGGGVNVTTKTATDTLTVAEQGSILCNSVAGFTLNLPTAVGNEGLCYFITNINSGDIVIDPDGAETIHGDATFTLYQDENINLVSDNATWWIR
jgi:hypothetical protein